MVQANAIDTRPIYHGLPIAFLNRCTVMEDEEAEHIVQALRLQVDRDFGPVYGKRARLHYVPKKDAESWKGQANILLLDTSDEAGALGYHDMTPEGYPLGKCFLKTDLQYGALASVTMSHELLEMLGDPWINFTVQAANGDFYAFEVCDAVEADELAYEIEWGGVKVKVSDFQTPPWFIQPAIPDVSFSFMGNVTQPFQLAKGGYTIIWNPSHGWTQAYAEPTLGEIARRLVTPSEHGPDAALMHARPRVGSRRERRMTPRTLWQRSVA